MLKRPIDTFGGYSGGRIGSFHEERIRYEPPQKRARYQTQTRFQSAKPGGGILPYHHNRHQGSSSNVSRVSNYGDVINSNSSNISPFVHSQSQSYGYGNPNPNPQLLSNHGVVINSSIASNISPLVHSQTQSYGYGNPNPNPQLLSNYGVVINSCNSSNISPLVHSQSYGNGNPNPNPQLVPLALPNRKLDAFDSLPECLDFDKIDLNVRHESVVKSLYSDMPRQCSSCGVRFKCQEEHSKHMDWHVRKNRMAKDAIKATTTTRLSQKPKKSRDWFASSSLWLSAATGATAEGAKPAFGETQNEEEKQEERMVHADENQRMCALCLELLDEFFSHEKDDWMYRDASYLNMKGLRRIVHVKCMPEPRKGPAID